MELVQKQPRTLLFSGNGADLFGILVVNILLMIVTLGFYYPWAKARKLRYLYAETELDGNRFTFHGTGKEIFWGFIKSVVLMIVLYGALIAGTLSRNPFLVVLTTILFFLAFFIIVPLAIHGSMRYRMSRTSWRGIHFGYRGDRWVFVKKFIGGILLTVITLYIYLAWFIVDIRKYMIGNIRFGDVSFKFIGTGGGLFLMNLKGLFLTLITFGIYSFWWMRDMMRFYVDNTRIIKNEKEYSISFTGSAGGIFKLIFVNYLLIIFTLGIAIPWVMVRTLKFVYSNAAIDGEFDTSNILQTEQEYKDAMGDDLVDMFDINII